MGSIHVVLRVNARRGCGQHRKQMPGLHRSRLSCKARSGQNSSSKPTHTCKALGMVRPHVLSPIATVEAANPPRTQPGC